LTVRAPQVECPRACGENRGGVARGLRWSRDTRDGGWRDGVNLLAAPLRREEDPMFDYRDLFQWERFITPSIIKIFYWLAVGMSVLFGLAGIISGLAYMVHSPFGGLFSIAASLIGIVIGVIFARIISEFVLIMFRINEHLGAIRQRGQM
jgi:hypothetical protein